MNQFAACGSCFNPEMIIRGRVFDGITFVSKEYSGTMNNQKFWDDLAAFAKSKCAFVRLMYQ